MLSAGELEATELKYLIVFKLFGHYNGVLTDFGVC